jgi:hypothetical protein
MVVVGVISLIALFYPTAWAGGVKRVYWANSIVFAVCALAINGLPCLALET